MEQHTIDTPRNLAHLIKVTPALCLDLDGTVRKSKSGTFIKDADDIELIEGVEEIIWTYRRMGWLIIGVSNQGGISFGYKRPSHIEKELDATLKLFKLNPFHLVKMCYHMEGGTVEPFNHRSMLRKPNTGMLALAEAELWNHGYMVDWDKSIMVGDRPEDEQLAKNASIQFYHIETFITMPHSFNL